LDQFASAKADQPVTSAKSASATMRAMRKPFLSPRNDVIFVRREVAWFIASLL
jgi:hypothetical protein